MLINKVLFIYFFKKNLKNPKLSFYSITDLPYINPIPVKLARVEEYNHK